MINLSNWRSVRLWESSVERQLRRRHWLGLHGLCIGSIVLAVMWAAAHLQMLMGSDSLALRYAATLGVGYLVYLLVLRSWAAVLVGRRSDDDGWHGDLQLPDVGGSIGPAAPAPAPDPAMVSGGGGDFAGAGASGIFRRARRFPTGWETLPAGRWKPPAAPTKARWW